MAHELDTSRGRAAYFGVGTPAWHGLGKTIESAATSAQAIKLAELDWTVEQHNIAAAMPGGEWKPISTHVANVRSDTGAVLGVVGSGYQPFQNAEAFDFMDAIVGDKLAMFHTAGALKEGRRVWMLAKIPKEYRIAQNDTVEPYALLANGHDGTLALRCFCTMIRVVCANTLRRALNGATGEAAGISIRHTAKLADRVDDARRALGVVVAAGDRFAEEASAMADRKLSREERRGYFDSIFPTKVKPAPFVGPSLLDAILETQAEQDALAAELLAGHYATSERQATANRKILDCVLENHENARNSLPGIEGSAWAAYNAVSEWVDHQRGTRGRTIGEQADNRLNSIWFGSGDAIKQDAYAGALAFVGK